MCYNFNNKKVSLKKAVEDLGAEGYEEEKFVLNGSINAFTKQPAPAIPAVVNYNGIVLMNTFWGVKENPDAPTKGKNLQSENTRTYYRKIEKNRCLIPASSYFEHKSISVPGRKTPAKAKYEIFWKDKAQFYIAGYFDVYADGNLGFGLVTTLPNPVQAEIHDRMIITLDAKTAREFLEQEPIEKFQFPNYSPNLEYINLEPEKTPYTLF